MPAHHRVWPVILSFLAALSLEVMPMPGGLVEARPAWLAMTVVFWAVADPRRYGLGVAWLFGLLMDVLKGAILGQHALALSVVAFIALKFRQRIRVFPIWQQTVTVTAIVGVYAFLILWIDGLTSEVSIDARRALPVAVTLVLWPLLSWFLGWARRNLRIA
jgi:rod shape-determining protein MreD